MLEDLLVKLEDPVLDLALFALLALVWFALRFATMKKEARARYALAFVNLTRGQVGAAQLTQQSVSSVVTLLIAAFAIALVGYTVIQMVWTGICSSNLTQIAAGEDLRYDQGYGYTTNGDVTAAGFQNSSGTNDYIGLNDPHDPSTLNNALYTFNATETNGDWTYTIVCPGTHAGWTTVRMPNGGTSHTTLELIGPGGVAQAK